MLLIFFGFATLRTTQSKFSVKNSRVEPERFVRINEGLFVFLSLSDWFSYVTKWLSIYTTRFNWTDPGFLMSQPDWVGVGKAKEDASIDWAQNPKTLKKKRIICNDKYYNFMFSRGRRKKGRVVSQMIETGSDRWGERTLSLMISSFSTSGFLNLIEETSWRQVEDRREPRKATSLILTS